LNADARNVAFLWLSRSDVRGTQGCAQGRPCHLKGNVWSLCQDARIPDLHFSPASSGADKEAAPAHRCPLPGTRGEGMVEVTQACSLQPLGTARCQGFLRAQAPPATGPQQGTCYFIFTLIPRGLPPTPGHSDPAGPLSRRGSADYPERCPSCTLNGPGPHSCNSHIQGGH
jgi:hypothetical protein